VSVKILSYYIRLVLLGQLDGRSMSLESGRYMETVGTIAVPYSFCALIVIQAGCVRMGSRR